MTEQEVLDAANIAASKFGSNDPAICREDFVSIAATRILQRDPWNMGTAVLVGREAIGRVISQTKYKKQFQQTCRGSEYDTSERLPRGELTIPEAKKRRHAWEIIRTIGHPISRFGKYGVIYRESVEPSLRSVYFDPIEQVGTKAPHRLRLLIKASYVTREAFELADSHFVLLLVPNGKESKQENAAGVAGPVRETAVSQA